MKDLRDAEEKKAELDGSRNLMLSDVMLQNIAPYGMMHCSQSIVEAMMEATRLGLPSAKTYFESRVSTTEHPLLGLSQFKMEDKKLRQSTAVEGDYGIVEAPAMTGESQFTE